MYPLIQMPPIADHIPDGKRHDLYTIHEVAERLGRSAPYVRRRIHAGLLVGVHEGDRVMVRSGDLDAYIAGLPVVGRAVETVALQPATGGTVTRLRAKSTKKSA